MTLWSFDELSPLIQTIIQIDFKTIPWLRENIFLEINMFMYDEISQKYLYWYWKMKSENNHNYVDKFAHALITIAVLKQHRTLKWK